MKRLNWIFFVAVALVTSVAFVSCEKDTLSEEEALKLQSELDTVQNLNDYTIDYSVVLVDASSTTMLKSAEKAATFGSAVVTIAQGDTTWTEIVKDANDMVYFSGLRYGYAVVNIVASGYSEVNYTIFLDESNLNNNEQLTQYSSNNYEVKRYQAANIIPMLPIDDNNETATISGNVTYDTDLTNTVPESASGITVLAMVKTGSSVFGYVTDDMNVGSDVIVTFSYGDMELSVVTGANGEYSIPVPAANNGIEYEIIVPRFTATQTLFDKWTTDTMYYSKTVTTAFGVGTDNNVGTTTVPSVSPLAMVQFSAPDYSYTNAQLDVVFHDDKNIGSAIVVDAGDGNYLPGQTLTYTIENTNSDAPGSDLTLNLYTNAQGYIYRAEVAGNGGLAFDDLFVTSNKTIQYVDYNREAVITFNDLNTNGIIDNIGELTLTDGGKFYIDNIANFSIVRTGTASTNPSIELTNINNFGSFTNFDLGDINIVDGGAGVSNGTTFTISPNLTDNTKAVVDVEFKGGIVSAITVTNGGSNYVSSGTVEVEISDNTGKGAKASATVVDGIVEYITMSDNGEGYSASATARIINNFEPKLAKASASISGTRITGLSLTDAGAGYYSDPTVTIIPGIGGTFAPTTGATATAEFNDGTHVVENLEVDLEGLGYRGNIPSSAHGPTLNNNSDFSVSVTAGATYEAHIYLGTGRKVPGSEDYEY